MKKICAICKSENVMADAAVSWNDEINQWEIETVYDNAYCADCDGDTNIEDMED